MAIRVPRGYARNRPYFREVCEGARPNIQAAVKLPYTGLPHVRVDETTHDPFVLDPGTLVGVITGIFLGQFAGSGTLCPAFIETGAPTIFITGGISNAGISMNALTQPTAGTGTLRIAGSTEASTWSMPTTTSGQAHVGNVKPMGVIFAPVYSSMLTTAFTNYKRQHSVAFLTSYVIQVPATNSEEVAINPGDLVMLGSGKYYGIGWAQPFDSHLQAGRYAKYDSTSLYANERLVGRCLKKTLLGQGTSATAVGDLLADAASLTDFTASTESATEFNELGKVETVPGLGLSGSGTKGIPAFLLGARADSTKRYWALTILIRI